MFYLRANARGIINIMDLIEKLESYRIKNGLRKADMSLLLGANSQQQYNNWVYRGSLPKTFYDRAHEILGTTRASNKIALDILKKLDRLPDSQLESINSLVDALLEKKEQ